MEDLRLIHDFTDGTLNPAEEEQLFQMLASNNEYRNELKQHLAIKSAVKNDVSAYTPNANSTMKVFASLGFAAPIADKSAMSNKSKPSNSGTVSKSGFWSKFSSPIITAAVSTLATAIIAVLLFQPFLNDMEKEINKLQVQNQELSKQIDNQKLNNIPVVTSKSSDNKQISDNIIKQKPIIKYVYITKEKDNNLNNDVINGQKETNDNSNIDMNLATIVTNKVGGITNNYINVPDNGKYVSGIDFSNIYIRQDLGLSLEINRLINWFDAAPTISPSNYNKLNNTAISLFYSISNNFSLGAEYRQETFFQTFRGLDNKGKLFEYQQQPNFTSGGIVARYAFNNLKFYGIVPYLQGYGGITSVGYIGRLMIGLKYSPYPNISFIISGERSQLFYKYQNRSFNNGKIDLNYGVSFSF